MLKTLKKYFDFCNREDRNKLYLAVVLGVVRAIFAALRITAIAVVVQGLIEGKLTSRHLWLSLGIMALSVLGQFCINLKTTMLQCEAGYHSCADKRIEIAEHLRYLPMGFFNRNSLGAITNVTTNTLEALGDIATRIVMVTTQGILTTAVIAVFVLCFDWRIGLILVAGIAIYTLFNTVMQHMVRPVAPRKHRADEDLVTQVIEYVQGIAEVKNYSLTDDTAKKLDAAITEKQIADTKLEYAAIPGVTLQNIATKLTGVVMSVMSLKFYFDGTMELLYCIMMMVSAFLIYESLDSMSAFTALLRNINIAVTKTKEIMDMPPMDIDGAEITPAKRDIELKNVTFGTVGGLDVDTNIRVLKADHKTPFEGFYAIGLDSHGVLLTPEHNYIGFGGVAQGWYATSGLLASSHAVSYVNDNFGFTEVSPALVQTAATSSTH